MSWLGRLVSDNQGVPDEVRFAFVVVIVVYTLAFVSSLFTTHPWPPLEFAGGVAAIIPAFGVGLRARGTN